MWQHLVDSTGGLETLKKQKLHEYQTVRCEAGNHTGTTERSTKCPQRSSPPPAAFPASPPFNLSKSAPRRTDIALGLLSPSQWFLFCSQSVLFFYFLKEEAGCHWLSSSAQTCCGHPVRPFTFFSVPKDSCRPSVCDTKNTPNYHHHQQQKEEEEEATNKPQSVWTFSADYYISCYSAGQTKRAGKCGRLFDFSKSSDTTESESHHVICGFRKVSGEPASTHSCFIIP